jgi:prefoldin subunit 5
MAKNLVSFGNLRNTTPYDSKEDAVAGITSEGINDGVIKLARYKEGDKVKTIFGISYTPYGEPTTYTIYDSYKEAIDDVINELKGNVSEEYDSLEKIEDKIKENQEKAVITLSSKTPSDSASTIAKTYTIYQGGLSVGDIDIYKDSFLKTVELVDEDGHVIDDEHHGIAKYIRFIFLLQDGTESIVNIPIDSFIQDLEAGKGLVVDAEGRLNIVKDANSEDFLEINEDSIAIVGVQDAITRAFDEAIERLNAEIARAIQAENELNAKIEDIEVIGSDAIEAEKNESGRKTTVSLKLAPINEEIVGANPLSVTNEGLTFTTELDCGFYDTSE